MSSNLRVAKAWSEGKKLKSGSMKTDGISLYSYDLLIGVTENGKKIVFNYSQSGVFKSQTTSRHVSKAKRFASRTQHPR